MQGDLPVSTKDLAKVDANRLPPQVREFVQLIGIEDTFRLLVAEGGRQYVFPTKVGPASRLVRVVSGASAQRLVARNAGARVDMPKPDSILRQVRNQRIIEARKSGCSARMVARQFDLCIRSVRNIYRAAEAA